MGNADTKLAFRKAVVHLTTKTQVSCYYTLMQIIMIACCRLYDDRYHHLSCRMPEMLATGHAHAGRYCLVCRE